MTTGSIRRGLQLAVALAAMALSTRAAAYDYFFEDFSGPQLDASRWSVGQVVSGQRWCSSTVADHHSNPGEWVDVSTGACFGIPQAAPYGAVTFVDEGGTTAASFSSPWPNRTFPYLFAGPGFPRSPFPPDGDFVFEIRFRYDGLSGHGDGIMLTGWPNPAPLGDNPPSPSGLGVAGVWGDSSIYRPVGQWQTFRLEYVGGVYTSYLDGVQQGAPTASAVRPATIWLGNPVFTFWGVSTWSPLTVDYVRVSIPQIDVAVDVKPGGCPNPLNVNAAGVVPVAVAGSAAVDVARIDPASIRLMGVAPLRSALQDVTAPAFPLTGKSATDCTSGGPDGIVDLALKFDATALSAALGAVSDGEVRTLKLTGTLKPEFGGTAIAGEDVVVIIKK